MAVVRIQNASPSNREYARAYDVEELVDGVACEATWSSFLR